MSPTRPVSRQSRLGKLRSPRLLALSLQERIANASAFYLAFCFIVPVLLMYFVYLAMEIHPFGDGSVLVLDLNGQYVYFFEALRNMIYGEGSLLYTFFRALGGEFMGIYAYYLASPLSYIVALFPQSKILEALLTIILIKVGLCGLSFGFYLHKHTANPNKPIIVGFSVMYALSAFAVVHQNNLMWTDTIFWLPMLVLGLEQLILNRKYKLYVVSLAMTLMSNYYIGYMACIFSVLYFFYFYFSKEKEAINPKKERLHFLRTGGRFAVFSLLGAAIAGFVLLAAYYSLTFGKNEFSNPSWAFRTNFSLLDFLTKFLPGSYDTVRPEGLPFVYCGLLTVILIPVYFMSRAIRSREKVAALLLLAFLVLSFWIRPLELIWHGFQRPNWLNHRYSFMFCFLLLTMAYRGFGNLKKVGEKVILGVCAWIILFAAVCEKLTFETYVTNDEKLMVLETVWLTVFAAVALLVVLCLIIRTDKERLKKNFSTILSAVVCLEIFCSSLACVVAFDNDVTYSNYSGYHEFLDRVRPVVSRIKEKDTGFYRMEKTVHRRHNDNMALAIRGLSNSTSTLNADTLIFLEGMGYVSLSHLSQYRGGTPVSDSLLGIKYVIDVHNEKRLSQTHIPSFTEDGYTVYENPYAMSLAYGVSDAVADFDFADYRLPPERLNDLVASMLGEEQSLPIFIPVKTRTNSQTNCEIEESISAVTYEPKSDETSVFAYQTVATHTGMYYFYLPAEQSNTVKLSVNGNNLGNYLGADDSCVAYLGYFNAGDLIKVTLTLKDKPVSVLTEYDYFWYFDNAAYTAAMERLSVLPQWQINDEYEEDHLSGTIKTDRNSQLIQTTLAFDKGWKVYVDGEEVETFQTLDALVAFRIDEAGEHTLEMRYLPDVYVLGVILSCAGIAVLLLLCVTEFILKKCRQKTALFTEISDLWTMEDEDSTSHTDAQDSLPINENQSNQSNGGT